MVTLQLVSLHGDVVGEAPASGTTLAATFDADEFGNRRTASTRRYEWLGAKTRPADNPAGIVLMGVRLYNPTTGRFLSVDPVAGGSDNAYDYAGNDPLNAYDLDGRMATDGGGGWGFCDSRCEKQSRRYLRHIKKHASGAKIARWQNKAYRRLFRRYRRGRWQRFVEWKQRGCLGNILRVSGATVLHVTATGTYIASAVLTEGGATVATTGLYSIGSAMYIDQVHSSQLFAESHHC